MRRARSKHAVGVTGRTMQGLPAQRSITPLPSNARRVLHVIWAPLLWAVTLGITALIARESVRLAEERLLFATAALLPIALAAAIHGLVLALRRSRRRLEHQRAEVASVLHDLRAPLMTARSYLDLLAAETLGPLPGEARDAATRAAIAAARAQALALALGSEPRTALAARSEPVELASVLADVAAALDAEISDAGVVMEIGDLPIVRGDRGALYRVFANLVENAVKYRRHDGSVAHVSVSARRDGAHWRVAVRDWGIGIALEHRASVFEAGHRTAPGMAHTDGSGIGLATVRTLVREHGGEVSLAPDVLDGVCIEVMLPAE